MGTLRQSATRNITFKMTDSVDHVSGKTGLTVTVNLSKDGSAFAAAGGVVAEISSGWYKIGLTPTDTNTLGDLAFHCTAAAADATDFREQVVAFDPLADVLSTAVPGAYVAGSVGYALGTLTSGIGPIEWTYTLTNSVSNAPIAGATILITSDAAGTLVLAGPLITNASGQVTAFLPAGTVYVWRQANGYAFSPNPQSQVVA